MLSNNIKKCAISVREAVNPFSLSIKVKLKLENAMFMEQSRVCSNPGFDLQWQVGIHLCNHEASMDKPLALFIFQELTWCRDAVQNIHIFNVTAL